MAEVGDRTEMARLLGARMAGSYEQLRETQSLERDSHLLKTWIVEAQVGESAAEVVAAAFSNPTVGKYEPVSLSQIADDLHIARVQGPRNPARLYLDTSDSRFWLVHSMDASNAVDWVVERAIASTHQLDQMWLPTSYLEAVSRLGAFRGLGLDFDRRPIGDLDANDEASPIEYLKMQLWGNRARRVLDILREDDAVPAETTLSKVRIKYWEPDGDGDAFTVEEIKFNGKTTARGTSFEAHTGLVRRLIRAYQSQIGLFEGEYSLRSRVAEGGDGDAVKVAGAPLFFKFSRPALNLNKLLGTMFSSGPPFRLWGVPVQQGENTYRVEGVDLHVGGRVGFEVTSDFIRVYLPQGSCGNTVMRLLTNLQHHYDAKVQLIGELGESFGLQSDDVESLDGALPS